MGELVLSPRLAAIAERVPEGAKLADIGTDHAYLPVALLLAGKINRAIASDVNTGPLERGRETARIYGVSGLDLRLSDGLEQIRPGEADTIVIAGMGGELIARILSDAPWSREALLLLQPMSSLPELRGWLNTHDYTIRKETIVLEGEKRYLVFTVVGGRDTPYTSGELAAGRQRRGEKTPYRSEYLQNLIVRRTRAIEGMRRGNRPVEAEEAILRELYTMKEEWDAWQR